MILAATTIGDWIGLVTAIGAAIAACIAAWKGHQVQQAIKPPSNGVNLGSLAENQAVNLSTLVHMVAEDLSKQVSVPTPRQTQDGDPGATLADPPAKPTSQPNQLQQGPQA